MTADSENLHHKQAIDVTVEKLAQVYAKAALEAAEAQGAAPRLVEEMEEMVVDVLDRHPQLETLFSTLLVSADEKKQMLDRMFSGQLSESGLGLLQVLVQHDRLGLLRNVIASLIVLWEQRCDRVRVEVQFAAKPDASLQQEVADTLKTLLKAEPILTTTVVPELVAGFVVRVGDKVYDCSARSSLEQTRQAMINQAWETIQNEPSLFLQEK